MQPKQMEGSRALLFDRLVDENPGEKKEHTSYRVYDRDGLMQSVQRELVRLLNTRRSASHILAPSKATVLDYGIPDFSSYSAASPTDRQTLSSLISSAIAAFEPRLQSVRVGMRCMNGYKLQSLNGVHRRVRGITVRTQRIR